MTAKVKPVLSSIRRFWSRRIWDSFKKLDPRLMVRNPVMFVTMVGAAGDHGQAAFHAPARRRLAFLRANRPLALVHGALRQLCRSHGRGPRQGPGGHPAQGPTRTMAHKRGRRHIDGGGRRSPPEGRRLRGARQAKSIPADGEIIEGAATVDESAITGESAPVIREAGGDRSAVTGGTRVLSDEIVVRVTANPGESFWTA